MARRSFVILSLVLAMALGWLAWDELIYLQRGYSLQVGAAGQAGAVSHIGFPAWREAADIILWVAATASIVGGMTGRKNAPTAAWLVFAAALALGLSDVERYGTLGSPTSIWTILLLLLFALLTRFAPVPGAAP